MSRKDRHNKRVRARILEAAGDAFRRDGFRGTRIDDFMEDANLTRGAFYAHFPSKGALLSGGVLEDDLLMRALRARSDAAPDVLWLGLQDILRRFLSVEHFETVTSAWSLPMLAQDIARGDAQAKAAYERVFRTLQEEMARGQTVPANHPAFAAILTQACGGLSTAKACASDAARASILRAARYGVYALLDSLPATHRREGNASPDDWPD